MADIVDTADQVGSFQTLLEAIKVAGLSETLKGAGPFTVFAPTDEAFAQFPSGTIEKLLGDVPQLRKILSYHVLEGKVMSKDVANLDKATTIEGLDLKIYTADGVKINDANVVTPDVEADNGVIHVIDTVLVPQ